MLRQERKQRGWSQQYVADMVGVSRVAIQQIETSATRPSYEVLVKLLDLFGYSDPRKLFGAATPDNTEKPGGNQANP